MRSSVQRSGQWQGRFPLSSPLNAIHQKSASKCRNRSFKVSWGRLPSLPSSWKQFLWPGNSFNATYKQMQVSNVRGFLSSLPSAEYYKAKTASRESKLLLQNCGSWCSACSSPASPWTVYPVPRVLGCQQDCKHEGGHSNSQLERDQNTLQLGDLQIALTLW